MCHIAKGALRAMAQPLQHHHKLDCRVILKLSLVRHEAVVKLLLEAKADVESKSSSGRTPLSWAAWGGHEAVVKLLLEAKADVESKTSSGQTPLSWAAREGHEAIVRLTLIFPQDLLFLPRACTSRTTVI
jgi:hypothetical protein